MKKILACMLAALVTILSANIAMAGERATKDEAEAFVKKAALFLKKNGKDKAFAEFNDPKGQFIDRDLYIIGFLTNGGGVQVVSGGNAKMVGKNVMDVTDGDGVHFVREFYKVAASPAGKGWVSYKWVNPADKFAVAEKQTYIEKVDDVILGAGIYK